MCEVMTEKAAVEMPAPVTGRVLSISGQPGDMVAVGSELVVFDTDATSAAAGERRREDPRAAPRAADAATARLGQQALRQSHGDAAADAATNAQRHRHAQGGAGHGVAGHRAAAPREAGLDLRPSPAPGPRAASSRATSIPRWRPAPRAMRRRR